MKKLSLMLLTALLCIFCCINVLAAEDTVYLDGTGETDGAYTDLGSAVSALPNGGTVVVTGDTTVGTTSSGITLPAVGGKVTITSKEGDTDYGATINIARVIILSSEVEFNHIKLCNTHSSRGNIIACGNPVTIGEGVTTSTTVNRYPSVYGGAASGTVSYDSHVVVKSGYFRNVFGGNSSGTFSGDTYVEIHGATVHNLMYAGNEGGTFSGTSTLKLYSGATCGTVKADNIEIDLTDLGTVSATSFAGTITTTVPDGYELVVSGMTYTVRDISTEPAPTLVYVDGTDKTDGAYTDLGAAALALREGGTIVVCGDTKVDSAVTLSAGGELLVTSVYGGVDYTGSAALLISNDITLDAPTTFKDIVLEKAATGNDYIVANGNALTIDDGVYCRNNLATNYITIVGGALSGTFEGDSNITVKSGYFRNIYGGNYNGTFKGDSNITFIGGYVDNMVAGGTFMGNFEGDSHVNIGGDAVVVYTSAGSGVMGSCCGSGSTAYTFDGDIYINLYGSARVNQNVYGTTRYSNVTTTGDVYITVKDDAFVYQNLYAGGYGGTLNGNTSTVMDGGWVGVNLAAGSRSGTVNGDTYLEINGGQINYYFTNLHSSYSDVAGEYNVAGGGLTGAVNGSTTVKINGGDIYGNVYGGGLSTGTVSGNSTVTLSGGSIMCGAYADGKTEGSVSGTKTLNIDLSNGGALSLGLSANVNTLTGGGSLTLFPEATVTADTFSGDVALSINGVPQARDYITATAYDDATVTYTAQGSEQFVSDAGKFGISSDGYYASTKVTFTHYADASIIMRTALDTTGDKIAATSTTSGTTVYDLTPGLYNYVVYHASNDYKRSFIYITGTKETVTLDYTNYTPRSGNGFEAGTFWENTWEILETFYNTASLVGFEIPDTPYFTNNRYGTRQFTTNDELVEFVNTKVAACDYAYAYDLFTSPNGYTMPLVLFTKDEIPEGATLEEAAKNVGKTAGRDILMVTAIVHGNEPSAGEGALNVISEMCGDYGNELLGGNVGAVIIIPRLNPDGCETFTRNTPTAVSVTNLNRDYAILSSAEISGVAKAYDLFEPTFLIDCHEAPFDPQYGDSYTLTDIYDVGLMMAGTLNTPFVDATAAIKGDYENKGNRCAELLTAAMESIEKTGLRAYYYQTPMTFPANNSPYGLTNGSYTFLIEVPGITGGDTAFARRVFAQTTAIKEIFALAKDSDGALAKEVNEAREKVALSAQIYDVDTPIVLQHSYTRHDSATLLWNNPLIAADATVRKATNITKYYMQDIAIKYRSRPTAYVVPADASGIESVLTVLEKQGIAYYLLGEGTTLALAQYSGTSSSATLGAVTDVAFENGAYIIPVDGYKAYLIATLFEPECPDSGEEISTFAQAGYLEVSEIYRSTENYIAAKLGLDGTYVALALPSGKEVDTATVDGVEYTTVGTDDTTAYVVASDSEYYTVTFFNDTATTEIYTVGKLQGDLDGNGEITIADVLILIKAVLNGRAVDCDLNSDGKISLVDVIRLLKTATK